MIEADTPHHVVLRSAIDTGDFNVLQPGELDANRAHSAAAPVNQDFQARSQWSARAQPLHGELPGLRQRRRLLERHTRGLHHQRAVPSTDILCKPAPAARTEARQIAIHFVADAETLNPAAHLGDPSGDIRTENRLRRGAAERKRRAVEQPPIPIVE